MANPYFTRPASVTSGTVIRSDKYNSDLDTQESAFNALHDKLQHAVFLPETFSGNPNIPEQTVNDTFIYIDTSGNIALYPIATILEQFELVEQRYIQIEAWRAQVAEDALEAQESATLSQRFANENEDVEVLSGLYSAKHWAKHAEAQIPLIQAAGQEKVDLAQGYANANKNVEVEAGFYSAKHYSLIAADQIPLVEAAGQAKVDAAQTKVNEAQTKVTLAQNYANAAKNVQVESGFYSAKHYSIIAQEQLAIVEAAGQAKVDDAATQVSLATTQVSSATTQANNASASATKADNFANYAHNQLVPNSGGKYSSYHWAKEAEAYAQQTLSAVNGDFVPNTRTVNGKALSSNIIIGTGDIQGLSTVATSGSYDDLSNKPDAAEIGAAPATHGHTLSSLDLRGTFNINGSGPSQQNDGLYVSAVNESGSTNNPTYTAVISAQHSNIRSIHLSVDSAGYIYGMRTHSNAGTYTFQSKTKFADSAGAVSWGNVSGRPTLSAVATSGAYGDLSGRPNLSTVATSGSYNDLSNKPNAASVGAVPTSRTVNGKALSTNITLNSSDVGALSSSTTLSTLGGVPTTRTVNGKSLNTNITLNASDVGALPSSTTLNTLGGVPTSRKVNNKALTSNITLSASDVGALPDSQKGCVISRVTGSFTATKLAGVTEYAQVSSSNTTCTINDSAFAGNDKLIIHKQYQSGQLNITSGNLMYLPDGSSASSHHIPAGNACTVELIFTGSSSLLRIY